MPSKNENSASTSTPDMYSIRAERILKAWDFLVDATKYRSRFFFHSLADHKDDSPLKVLRTARSVVGWYGMIKEWSAGNVFYRARHYDGSWSINEPSELLAPPPRMARAGRMNPAGISYLYLAEKPQTALVEVRPKPGFETVVAEFELTRALKLLDLTDLNFSTTEHETVETRRAKNSVKPFLQEFVKAISCPVNQDGREHIDYVPSQIVCEYIAQVHSHDDEKAIKADPSKRWQRIHGIRFPSSLHSGGINVVLFPTMPSDTDGGFEDWVARTERPLEFHNFTSWADVGRLILE
jgi:hypothetical protein